MLYKQIYKQIKKYDTIVIARHIGADPDALASSIALKEIILNTFPNKEVLVVGNPAARFKFMGMLDKITDEIFDKRKLLIVTDTPDAKRIEGADPEKYDYVIKIDHHPFVEKYADLEWIDDKASSASQMIIELVFNSRLKLTKSAAEKLFVGIVADTGRFMYDYTSIKTFDLVSKLIKKTNIDFTKLYLPLNLRSYKDIKFLGYISMNLNITENGLGYIKIDEEILKEFEVDAATAGNLINNLDHISEVLVLIFCTKDVGNDYIRCSIRSRGPAINLVASKHNGGGHALASGAKPKTFEDTDVLITELDELCRKYKEENNIV